MKKNYIQRMLNIAIDQLHLASLPKPFKKAQLKGLGLEKVKIIIPGARVAPAQK